MSKHCVQCNKEVQKKKTCSSSDWNMLRFCSANCHNVFRKGKPSPSPSTTFKKGNKPSLKTIESAKQRCGSKSPSWRGGQITLTCKVCEMEFSVIRSRANKAKTCSRLCGTEYRKSPEFRLTQSEIIRKIVESKLGKIRSYITALDKLIRHSARYKLWRSEIFKRDNFTCQFCRVRGGELRADHIKQFALILIQNDVKTFDDALLCTELWDMQNGRTLCHLCHIQTPTYARRLSIINL